MSLRGNTYRFSGIPQIFTSQVDGIKPRFIHARSQGPNIRATELFTYFDKRAYEKLQKYHIDVANCKPADVKERYNAAIMHFKMKDLTTALTCIEAKQKWGKIF